MRVALKNITVRQMGVIVILVSILIGLAIVLQ